jgi:hypothetical protein
MSGSASAEQTQVSLQNQQDENTLERATGEQLSSAVGHYARARALLVTAIREFDEGQKLADPRALIDAQRWRSTLLDRAEDLERVLDPQPRASKTGVKFTGDRRLLSEASH